MSIRAQITFYEKETDAIEDWKEIIYRHLDGYPSEILPQIKKYGTDVEKYLQQRYKDGRPVYGKDTEVHPDIDFLYVVRKEKVTVFRLDYKTQDLKELSPE